MDLYNVDARNLPLADKSVHCCVTSPPYWGLRDYGLEPSGWGDWVGCLGLEPTPEMYVEHLVVCLRETKRVLRDDGVLWLNLGDCYAGSGKGQMASGEHAAKHGEKQHTNTGAIVGGLLARYTSDMLKPKDLVGIPWRVAFALQADGWWLRSAIVWHKPNCMPESVRDRPTMDYEMVFLLTKSKRYFYDNEAVKEKSKGNQGSAANFARNTKEDKVPGQQRVQHRLEREPTADNGMRNKRSVWSIPTGRFSGAHFAVFPPDLVEPCIAAGTSEYGCCPGCGAPWKRVVRRKPMIIRRSDRGEEMGKFGRTQSSGTMLEPARSKSIGWRPTCKCYGTDPWPRTPRKKKGEDDEAFRERKELVMVAQRGLLDKCTPLPVVPCVVLDPFAGAGTTLLQALCMGRDAVGAELNPEYCQMAMGRLVEEGVL